MKKRSSEYSGIVLSLTLSVLVGACAHGGPSLAGDTRERAEAIELLQGRVAANDAPGERLAMLVRLGDLSLAQARALREGAGGTTPMRTFGEWGPYYLLALRSFEEVFSRYPESPEAPRALLSLGKIHDRDGLDKPGLAESYYRKLVSVYPWSREAREAADRLGDPPVLTR